MKVLSLQAYPRPRPTTPDPQHRVYPYLLRGLTVDRPDQARCSDITYLPMPSGFVYLVAVMDWVSRYVLAWRVSNTLLPLLQPRAAAPSLRLRDPQRCLPPGGLSAGGSPQGPRWPGLGCQSGRPALDPRAGAQDRSMTSRDSRLYKPISCIPGVGWFAGCRDTEGNVMGFQRDDGAASQE